MICQVLAPQVRRALLTKGFCEAEHGSRDHEMFFLRVEQKRTAFWVKLSHGAKHISVPEIKRNAKSLKVTGDDLYRILCCDYDARQTAEVYSRSVCAQLEREHSEDR